MPMEPSPASEISAEISEFLERYKPKGMTLQLLAEEVNLELRKIGVAAPKVGVNTVWRWKKGIHEPDDVRATMLKRVINRWDRRKK